MAAGENLNKQLLKPLEKEALATESKIITGAGVSPGIAIGHAHLLTAIKQERTGRMLNSGEAIETEFSAFAKAVSAAVDEVQALAKRTGRQLNEEEQAIADTQVEFLTDPQLRENVLNRISLEKMPAIDAVLVSIEELVDQFNQMDDEYLRARAADISDIGLRISRHLGATGYTALTNAVPGAILVAEDIAPSDAIALDLATVAGFITRAGGKTSHTALLARAKGIPAVVGCGAALQVVEQGDLLIVNGKTGEVLVKPAPDIVKEYQRRQQEDILQLAQRRARGSRKAQTSDGTRVQLMLNIAGPQDLDHPEAKQADGVGLYRTEMLFMQSDHFPGEDEQLLQYRQVMDRAGQRPVTFRSVDIGGDKPLPYHPFPPEQNPFLGYRAIRFSLDRQDIFITQLRAILRATVNGNAGIMFPMIASLTEFRAAKAVLKKATAQLEQEGLPFNPGIRVGVMIEIPAAALIADLLAGEADFFSIGTNDLCQYTLAVDRMNESISQLYDPFHPGLLRLIRGVIEAGHQRGIPVGMCGEMAGEPLATTLLLGLGLREFSMSAASLPEIQDIVCGGSLTGAEAVAAAVSAMDDSTEIISYLQPQRL